MALRPALFLPLCVVFGACFETPSVDDTDGGSSDGTSTGPAVTDSTTAPATTGSTGVVDGTGSTSPVDPDTSTSDGDPDTSTGVAGAPEIRVTFGGAAVNTGDTLTVADNPAVGMPSMPLAITVENIGTDTLEVGGVLPQGGDTADFTINQAMLAGLIDPGETSDFTVRLEPVAGGIRQATFEINTNDPDKALFELIVRGHSRPNAYRPLAPPTSPSPRFNAAIAAIPDGRMVLFGGRNAAGDRLADTWVFDSGTEEWTELTPATSPSIRDAHQMATVTDTRVILFGGNDVNGSTAPGFNDTWVFNFLTGEWAQVFTAVSPPARYQHEMVAIDGGAFLFGGRGSGSDFNDVWIYDGLGQTWTNGMPVAPFPTARASLAMAFDGDETVTVYGGLVGFGPVGDTQNYNLTTSIWSTSASPPIAGSRSVLDAEYYGDTMVVFSGKLDSCCVNPSAGTFHYDASTDIWSNQTPPMEPPPRFNSVTEKVPGRNRAIIFGGLTLNGGSGSAIGDTWEYTGPLSGFE